MAKAETKSELQTIIDQLETRLAANADREAYQQREVNNARRLFMELWEDHRTLKLRFGWLEEAATDTVNSCEKHLPGQLVKLADELGIELKQEK